MRISHTKSQEPHNQKYEEIASATLAAVMQNSPMNDKTARSRIAEWLRDALEKSQITQVDLAREVQKMHVNLDQSKISRIIKLERSMSAEELLATAVVLKEYIPDIGFDLAGFFIADKSKNALVEFHPDLSELALEITKDLEESEYQGKLTDDEFIEASALIYTMLRNTGEWHPDLFEASKKMMSKVKTERKLSSLTFTDYVKSVAIYYRTLADAETITS